MKNKILFLKSNKGSGLPSVIIAIAFIAILGSVLLTVSFTNFNMKQTNLNTKKTFYSAEQALDEINIGLQNVISQAVSTAYLEVMVNYSSYDVDKKNDLMESVYFSTIWAELEEIGSNHTKYKLSKLNGYLDKTAWNSDSEYGAIITSTNNQMETYGDSGVVLKDVEIYYRDDSGYVSVIHTDIRLVLPDLVFAMDTVLPNIVNYTLIADEKLISGSKNTNMIAGEIYAGELDVFGDPTKAGTDERLNFEVSENTSFVVKRDINLSNTDFAVSDTSEVWTNDLSVKSSFTTIAGTINLADDTNISGDNSEVVFKKIYNGYGNSLDDSSKSSAILVNGTNAVLNLENCDMVTVAGHAYIGTKQNNLGEDVSGSNVGNDVLMGESVSVKSNQLMYLVPSECMGVLNATGNSMYNKNPLTASEYKEIKDNILNNTYTDVDEDIEVSKLGNTLKDYIKHNSADSKPEVEKVFVTTNGETLVYYYMSFDSEEKANEYFRDYYSINSDSLVEYLDFYSNGISIGDPKYMIRLQLAGNMLRYDETASIATASLQPNTRVDASKKLESTSVQYEKMKDSLCTKLVLNTAELTNVYTSDLSDDIVFDNIVDKPTLVEFINNYGSLVVSSKGYVFTDLLSNTRALVINNPTVAYVYDPSPGTLIDSVHLIIATGDVQVNADFEGLILSNGIVTLADGVSVTANSTYVKEALRLTMIDAGGTSYSVIGFLRDGIALLNTEGLDEEHDSVKLADLVVYENWKKE